MCTVPCARALLLVFNLVFWVAGTGLLGIGIWMKVDATIVNYLHVVNVDQADPLIDHAATLFIVVGAFVFVVGFLGCCGAIRKNQAMLFAYAVLVLLAMAAEIVGAVLALVYKGKVEGHLAESMQNQIKTKYDNGTATADAWDYLQVKLACCGGNDFMDYIGSQWWNETKLEDEFVPSSCCLMEEQDPSNPIPVDELQCQLDAKNHNKESAYLNHQGCFMSLSHWFHTHSAVLMGIGFGIGAIQLIGFVAACCLRSTLRREKP